MSKLRNMVPLLLLALALGGCASAPKGVVAGRILYNGAPVAEVSVTLVDQATGRERSGLTDGEGVYRFAGVESGGYLVRARDKSRAIVSARRDTDLYLAPGEEKWVGLKLVSWEGVIYRPYTTGTPGFGAITGVVKQERKVVSGAVVSLYLDGEEGFKGPGFRHSFPTGSDGAFFIEELAETDYYVVVRKRASGTSGPVERGDLYGEAAVFPAKVKSGLESQMVIHVVEKTKTRAPHLAQLEGDETAIKGVVLDMEGRPVAGVYVFAYRDRIVGHKMPDYLTRPTGEGGVFILPLGDGGLFYVGARQHYGGSPRPGEPYGMYDGSPDHGIRVPEGQVVDGITITVRKVLE